jgi:tetratricopeptide (TPR) repeat protein
MPPDLSHLSLDDLEARAQAEPANHWLHLERGVRYVRMRRVPEARTAFEHSLTLAPNTMEAYAYLGEMARQEGDYREAARLFERAVECNPKLAEGHLQLAFLCSELSNYRRGRIFVDRYVQMAPSDWQGHYLQGLIYYLDGDVEGAERSYSRSVDLAPERGAGYLATGLTYLARPATPEHLAAATSWFERGVEVQPRYANLHYYLGLARFRQERWEEAEVAFKEALRLDKGLVEARYPLGQTLRKLGRAEEARPHLEEFTRQRTVKSPQAQVEQALKETALENR